jgi:hypothetical protein
MDQVEPLGRQWEAVSRIGSLIWTLLRTQTSKAQALEEEDFWPNDLPRPPARKQSAERAEAAMAQQAKAEEKRRR